jgi:hypothetical protein
MLTSSESGIDRILIPLAPGSTNGAIWLKLTVISDCNFPFTFSYLSNYYHFCHQVLSTFIILYSVYCPVPGCSCPGRSISGRCNRWRRRGSPPPGPHTAGHTPGYPAIGEGAHSSVSSYCRLGLTYEYLVRLGNTPGYPAKLGHTPKYPARLGHTPKYSARLEHIPGLTTMLAHTPGYSAR